MKLAITKCAFCATLSVNLLLLCVSGAGAASITALDGSASLAINPYPQESTGFDTTTGFGVGISLKRDIHPENANFVTRVDLNHYRWSNNIGFVSQSHTRIPLFWGRRYFMLRQFYADIGIELSYAQWKSSYTGPLFGTLSPGSSSEHSDFLIGFGAGFGVVFPVHGNMAAGVTARYHFTSNDYVTGSITIGYRF